MPRLAKKVAIITGAAQGMGAAHARAMAREGARLVLTDLQVDAGQAVAEEIGEAAIFVPHDVADPASWSNVVEETVRAFGGIHVLVNNAGVLGPKTTLCELENEDYLRVIEINQHSIFFGMKAVIPTMIEARGGSIINISSIAGLLACSGFPNLAYVGSKFATRGMTKAAASEYGKFNIRVNVVHPGFIMTPMTTAKDDQLRIRAEMTMLKRLGTSDEVANLVVFLASDESSFITGSEHVIDAGMTAQ